jgi:RNA polymerase sigma-70 factor (ECF subfamily)
MEPPEQFDSFYAAVYPRLLRQFVAITGSRQDAEDVVQEAFARAAVLWDRVRRLDAPEAWVRRVALNVTRNELRRVTRALVAVGKLGQQAAREEAQPAAEPTVERSELVEALRSLPQRYREVLVLHYLVDLAVDQVAAELRLPVGTVTARLTRGRRALSQVLGHAGDAAEGRVRDAG